MNKSLMNLIIGVALFYVLFCGALYFMQRSMIYFPDKNKPPNVEGVQSVKVTSEDGQKIESWYFPPSIGGQPIIIYYHGNAGHHAHRIHKAIHYLQAGYGVLLAEYRGYGGNSGDISEEGIYKDARAQISWLINEQKISMEDIVIYGESIGSGPAVQMATEFPVKALVLEAPFASLYGLASSRYFFIPVNLLLKDRYMNSEKIKSVQAPLLIIHGTRDRTIPISSAKKLFEVANQPKTFKEYPQAGHNDLFDFGAYKDVIDFLASMETENTDND